MESLKNGASAVSLMEGVADENTESEKRIARQLSHDEGLGRLLEAKIIGVDS